MRHLIFIVFTFTVSSCFSQIPIKAVSAPELFWSLKHPVLALKSFKCSQDAMKMAFKLKHDERLDGDIEGGSLDAFKHTYWMALLTQKMSDHQARNLGYCHELGNYFRFLTCERQNLLCPEFVSTQMDLLNNEVGICLGRDHRLAAPCELADIVIQAIKTGKAWKIKKDSKGKYLNKFGQIIPEEALMHTWRSEKVLIPSNK